MILQEKLRVMNNRTVPFHKTTEQAYVKTLKAEFLSFSLNLATSRVTVPSNSILSPNYILVMCLCVIFAPTGVYMVYIG